MTDPFLKVFPHDPIEEVFSDVFFVRGSIQMGKYGMISRNMIVIRENGELSLIHAVRLSEQEEKKLKSLGTIKNVIKIGFFHGADDPYYVDKYKAKLWALPDHEHKNDLQTDEVLGEDKPLPFSRAKLLTYRNAKISEAVIFLEQHGGIVISCDSIQNFQDLGLCSLRMKILIKLLGFYKPANIGPFFLKFGQHKKGQGPSLREDFERILDLNFKHLLSAHGLPLKETAKEQFIRTFDRVYPKAHK